MGKVTTYCQISGCSPEVEYMLDMDINYLSDNTDDVPEAEKKDHGKVREAIKLLATEDEKEGIQALSIIGPFDDDNSPIWQFEENPTNLDGILAEAEGCVRELPGCRMGDAFDMGCCEGPNGEDDDILVSYGGYFFVQTNMLAILAGATQGRVSVQRLWRLAMIKGYYDPHNYSVLPGVDYGPISNYLEQFPWVLGDMTQEELPSLGSIGSAKRIAELLRKRGFWMWMRPDRFPVDLLATPQQTTNITEESISERLSYRGISKLPPEINVYLIEAYQSYLPR
ncbi:unnamed protein product [Rhizoctonia solani]|uniref:Uncharacterized protein n=1 Tax=Rhizoctonia solani TaxID=456999 RepID=A0A8H3BQ48_9AGAM|nr:unnamed protein product [Rhizoctonia solani]